MEQNEEIKLRLPDKSKREMFGIITKQTGAEFLKVLCEDNIERACRIPGRLRRRKIWLRENDVVIVQVWEYDDKKGDIVYKYYPQQAKAVRERGYLDKIEMPEW